jgi:tetratricopeptide (TPR) repeat protein
VAGDLIAERRFAYAKAAAEEGDLSAAAELFEQALERAPHWAVAWFALGEAREKLGDLDTAARAFRETLVADPADTQGAMARVALIGRGEMPSRCPSPMSRDYSTITRHGLTHISSTISAIAPQPLSPMP